MLKERLKSIVKTSLFKQLLTLAVQSLCFIFNDIYYKQIDGVAMGSPLGPTFANLFLVSYEHKWLENCPWWWSIYTLATYCSSKRELVTTVGNWTAVVGGAW